MNTLASYSSAVNKAPIFMSGASTLEPAEPNSSDLISSGKTLNLQKLTGKPSTASASFLVLTRAKSEFFF